MTNARPFHSPLDDFLVQFLVAIVQSERGFTPGQESSIIAKRLDVQREFVDTLYTSARTRGLLKPAYGRGSKVVWQVSPSGLSLIELIELKSDQQEAQNNRNTSEKSEPDQEEVS